MNPYDPKQVKEWTSDFIEGRLENFDPGFDEEELLKFGDFEDLLDKTYDVVVNDLK